MTDPGSDDTPVSGLHGPGGEGGQWRPMEGADRDALILLAVRHDDQRRVFVSRGDYPPSGFRWVSTSGTDFSPLHSAWEPVAWMPLPEPPK